jgi:hypothetical protein
MVIDVLSKGLIMEIKKVANPVINGNITYTLNHQATRLVIP